MKYIGQCFKAQKKLLSNVNKILEGKNECAFVYDYMI